MREVRLRFSKTGQAKYISHLDTNRVFSRALARAKINLWYTQGFNPRPYMSFSLPLSLGVESYCENVDLRILDDLTDEEIKDRMNNALPLGIRIVDVYEDFMDCHDIVYSDYVYKFEFKDNETALEKIIAVLESDEILAQKKAKQGKRRILKETDIKQFIVKYNASIRNNNIVLNIRLLAGPDKNLNPTLLFDTIIRLIDMDYEWKSIGRISLLTKDFKEYK
ncbi:TIGR03936 family radical SAM-associated protein [Eubacterium coprostanoligenes]|uniref:Radical SAM-linked protein n=1 Tax=Eubacterium coprostanoligenes TaxID=290054 RepID=A0A1T4NFI4_9FIRM|nr:TIGR03936 family radical SAM-associated protein [Eubacterium coprostanoligenes]SJZ77895.1 radical SAM-linked protein [Eubacterium coprostanoligenes]